MKPFSVQTRLSGIVFFLFFLLISSICRVHGQTTTETLSAGSFIINMGVLPQTDGNALRPYGLIYALLRNHNVPIKWVINPTKGRDGVDFTHNGVSYRGGTFIIPAEFRTAAVNATISSWIGQGVVGANTVSAITVPVYDTIRSFPRWALNPEKTDISSSYLRQAGLPTTSYYVRQTRDLGACDDIFLVPHDDNISGTNLSNWNNVHRGYIWIGCKAGSVMENSGAAFLSTTGVNGEGSSWGNPSVTYGFNNEPPMQFMGSTAHIQTQANGANRSYTPRASWRPTTRQLIHITNSTRSAMVYGPGFGDANRGWVMISGGHDYNKDVSSAGNRIAVIRAMLNFSYMSVLQKSRTVTMTIPSPLIGGVSNTLSHTVSPAIAGLSTQWSSSCGGTFSPNATSATVSFTPPVSATNCIVTVQVSDNCGRVSFDSRQVPVSCVLNIQRTAVGVSCFGGNNGAINMTISGASGPYSWSWSRVSPMGSGNGTGTSITGLSAGTYNVTVNSASGCTAGFSILVGQPNSLLASASASSIACFGQSTGSVNLTVNGGSPPYTYSWTRTGGGFSASTQNLTGLTAGTYNVTVTDGNSCTTTASAVVTGPSSALSASVLSTTDINCAGGNTGAINLSVSGGTSPYTYLWSDGATTQNRTGLSAGTYSVTVRDANNCTRELSGITINSLSATTIALQSSNISCFGGGNGSIQLTATGVSPFNIAWTGPSSGNPAGNEITVSGGSFTIPSLVAGTYTLTVTDGNGCVSTRSRTLTSPAALTATATGGDFLCFGDGGSVNLAVNGGSPPYTYSWTRTGGGFSASTQNLTGLTAGTYNVTVTDGNSCTTTASAVVTGPSSALSASVLSTTDINCAGGNTGAINLSVSGGTSPYTYLWSDGATTQNRTGLSAGTYSVTVRDANNCTRELSGITINSLSATTIALQSSNISCFGGGNGSIQLTATGVSPFNIAWTGPSSGNPAGNEITVSGGSFTIPSLVAGTYTLTVTDGNGCVSTRSRTLTSPAALTATATGGDFLCFGDGGAVNLTVSGGTSPYTYSWTRSGGGFSASTQNLTGLTADTYNVIITDANGCTASGSAVVSGPGSALSASVLSTTDVACSGGSTGAINLTTSGGTSPYTYLWSNGATTASLTGLSAGAYSVRVTDANGCIVTTSTSITQPPVLSLSMNKSDPTCPPGAISPVNSDGTITLTVSGGRTTDSLGNPVASPYTYAWTTLDGSGLTPTAKDQTSLRVGTYSVTVTDLNGCTATLTVTLLNQNTLPSPPPTIIINNN